MVGLCALQHNSHSLRHQIHTLRIQRMLPDLVSSLLQGWMEPTLAECACGVKLSFRPLECRHKACQQGQRLCLCSAPLDQPLSRSASSLGLQTKD